MPFTFETNDKQFSDVGNPPDLRITRDVDAALADSGSAVRPPPLDLTPLTDQPRGSEEQPDAVVTNPTPGVYMSTGDTTDKANQPSVLGAAFRTENMVVGAIEAARRERAFQPEEGHNPYDLIKGTEYEANYRDFLVSESTAETQEIMRRIDKERADRQVLADAGWRGTAASMLATILDPTILLPVGGVFKGLKAGEKVVAAGKSAAAVGAAAGAGTAIQEAALQSQQYERTAEESAFAIGGTIILGGLLGGTLSGLSSREFSKLGKRLDDIIRVPEDDAADAFGMGGFKTMTDPKGIGAQAIRKSPVELESAFGIEKAMAFQDPLLRSLNSPLKAVREATTQLAETVLGITRNAKGETTAPIGGAVETRIKTQGTARLGSVMEELDKAFSEYRFAQPNAKFAAARAGFENYMGQSSKLTYKQFKEEVGRAMARHDKHDVPEVARVAAAMRAKLFEPLAEQAVKYGIYPEEILTGKAKPKPNASPEADNIVRAGNDIRRMLGIDSGKVKPADRPEWGSKKDLEMRSIQQMVRTIEKVLGYSFDPNLTDATVQALMRVQPDLLTNVQEQFAKAIGNTTDEEIASVKTQWEFIQSQKGVKPAERLIQWIVKQGGLKDDGGDILQIIGKHKARPFLIAKNGNSLDDLALRAWEAGFLQGGERPTVNDLIEAIREDFAGKPFVRSQDSEAMLNLQQAEEFRELLAKHGADEAKTADEAAELFIASRANEGMKRAAAEAVQMPEVAMAQLRLALEGALGHPSAAPMATREDFSPAIADELWDDKGQSYVTRIYNKGKIMAEYPRFKRILTDWFEGRQQRALGMVSRLERAGFEDTVSLREFAEMTKDELQSTAANTIKQILGQPDGRMAFELPADVRGPLKSRTLRIPDELIEEFLERDIEHIARYYTRTVVPDIEMIRMFGDLEMSEHIAKISDEADEAAAAAKTKEEATAILEAAEAGIKDLQAMSDRLRGTYGLPEDPTAFLPRLGRTVRSLNYLRLLGGMTLSALSDVFRPMMTQGIKAYFADGIAPLFRNLEAVKLANDEVKMCGTAWDMVLDTRVMQMADLMDDFGRYSKFERAIASAQNNFGFVSLMAPWNTAAKQFAGRIATSNVIKAAQAVADGTAGDAVIRKLAASSIDEFHARIIAREFATHGKLVDGVYLPNSNAWDISNANTRNALEAFRAAVVRDVDRTILTPGQDKPLWMSTQVGAIVGQFKSFGFATVQRTIIAGLQERDAGVLAGAVMMVGMGAVSEYLKAASVGRKGPDSFEQWLVTSIDRSGVTAYLFDVNHVAEQWTGGAIGLSALTGRPVSRYAARNVADSLFGPTGGLLKDMAGATSGISHNVFKGERLRETDLRALRRAIPYQNLFYMSWLFQQMEASAVRAVNAIPAPKRN